MDAVFFVLLHHTIHQVLILQILNWYSPVTWTIDITIDTATVKDIDKKTNQSWITQHTVECIKII